MKIWKETRLLESEGSSFLNKGIGLPETLSLKALPNSKPQV